MMQFLIPTIALTAAFLSLILSLVYVFGRRFYLWIFPLLISAVLFGADFIILYGEIYPGELPFYRDITETITLVLFALSVLFLILTVLIRLCANSEDTKKRHFRQAVSESKYVEKRIGGRR